jgi:hypothetical protein
MINENERMIFPGTYSCQQKESKTSKRMCDAHKTWENIIYLCSEYECQLLWIKGVAWSLQHIPMAVNLGFLDRSRYFSIQVDPQLSSRG